MNYKLKSLFFASLLLIGLSACNQNKTNKTSAHKTETAEVNQNDESKGMEGRVLHLSLQKFKAMGIEVDSIPVKSLSENVKANGKLEVPPQNEAAITAIIGANVTTIKVIEGDRIKKGQILAYLSHPDLVKLQTDYVNTYSNLQYLQKEFRRQKSLYEGEVASGKTFQKTTAEYNSAKALVSGLEAQLRLLGVNPKRIREGKIYSQVPVISPIDGYVEKVNVKIGQFVPQQKEMFEIVNTNHIHADLMVFEKDVRKVKEGQIVEFQVEALPGQSLRAKIYSVGKTFEKNPKAVHVHAEIQDKKGHLLPGMYITGIIETTNNRVPALPEEAIVTEKGDSYIFTAEKITENGSEKWALRPLKVVTGVKDNGWVEIKLLHPLPKGEKVALNKAYYLISEMKKGETEHGH